MKTEKTKGTMVVPRRLETVVGCSSDEQETTIGIIRDLDRMDIYTSDNTMITKLNKILEKDTKGEYEVQWTNNTGSRLTAPKSFLTLRSGVPNRRMSEEQKEQAKARMIQYHKERRK